MWPRRVCTILFFALHTATELNNEEEVAMLEFGDAEVAGDAMDHGDEDYGIGYSGI